MKFKDIVRTIDHSKAGGEVVYVACKDATSQAGKKCDKKICQHLNKDYMWVRWLDKKIFSYHYTELELDTETQPLQGVVQTKPLKEEVGGIKQDSEKLTIEKQIAEKLNSNGIPLEQMNWDVYNKVYKGFGRGKSCRKVS
jgi:hypothetical protein